MLHFTAPDGTEYTVNVVVPAASNAVVFFRHPGGLSARKDRYNWFLSHAPEALNVTSRLDPAVVEEKLDQPALAKLFRRSMPVSRPDPIANQYRSHTTHVGRD